MYVFVQTMKARWKLKCASCLAGSASSRHFTVVAGPSQGPKTLLLRNGARVSIPAVCSRRHPSAPPAAQFHASDRPARVFTAPSTDEEAAEFLKKLLPPLDFSSKLVRRIITHPSWKAGVEGHNTRLSFMGTLYPCLSSALYLHIFLLAGRRALNAYLVLFLHDARIKSAGPSAPSKFNHPQSEVNYQAIVDFVLSDYQLGHNVGKAWKVDRVMRWISAVVSVQVGKHSLVLKLFMQPDTATEKVKSTGRNAVRAETVEAIIGGVLHQYVRYGLPYCGGRTILIPDLHLGRDNGTSRLPNKGTSAFKAAA